MDKKHNSLRTKELTSTQSVIHAACAALAAAFFIQLMGMGDKSNIFLVISVYCFLVALATNSALVLLIKTSSYDEDFLWHLNTSKFFFWVSPVAQISVYLGFTFLIFSFSWLAGGLFLSVSLLISICFYLALKNE